MIANGDNGDEDVTPVMQRADPTQARFHSPLRRTAAGMGRPTPPSSQDLRPLCRDRRAPRGGHDGQSSVLSTGAGAGAARGGAGDGEDGPAAHRAGPRPSEESRASYALVQDGPDGRRILSGAR